MHLYKELVSRQTQQTQGLVQYLELRLEKMEQVFYI